MPRVTAPKLPLDPALQKEQDKLLVEFGKVLRKFRKEQELSLESTADAAGVHPNYLGEVERGQRNISLYNIWRLAGALDLPPSALLEGLAKRKVKPAVLR